MKLLLTIAITLLLAVQAMSYEVHILRPEGEISLDEWRELIAANDKLEAIEELSSKNPATGEVITIQMPNSAKLQLEMKDAVLYLRFSRGQLHAKIQEEADIEALKPIAKELKAVIEGDEGERY